MTVPKQNQRNRNSKSTVGEYDLVMVYQKQLQYFIQTDDNIVYDANTPFAVCRRIQPFE
jgi:hypothetical protein